MRYTLRVKIRDVKWHLYGIVAIQYYHQPVQAKFLISLYRARRLQNFVNSTSKFNSIVVKTLKPVLCHSRDGVPLNLDIKKTFPVRKLISTVF
jgi:hypothetical protein